jgi:hypothetical protein
MQPFCPRIAGSFRVIKARGARGACRADDGEEEEDEEAMVKRHKVEARVSISITSCA